MKLSDGKAEVLEQGDMIQLAAGGRCGSLVKILTEIIIRTEFFGLSVLIPGDCLAAGQEKAAGADFA